MILEIIFINNPGQNGSKMSLVSLTTMTLLPLTHITWASSTCAERSPQGPCPLSASLAIRMSSRLCPSIFPPLVDWFIQSANVFRACGTPLALRKGPGSEGDSDCRDLV